MTKPDDVIKTKSALSSLGNYDVPDFGLTDVPDMGMINGLKNFQADNGLKVDGIMKPGGPTENALGQTLAHQGITNTNLMETAKAQAPKTVGDLPEDTRVSATSSFKDNSVKVQQPNLEKHKSLKVDPNTGMVQKKTPAPKPQKDMSKVWDDFYKQKEKKAKTAVIPQGDTVDKRIRSIMDDERYWKKREQPITDHVVKQFEKAYPGETQYDETGKMIQPKAVIQPDEVEPFDPEGELDNSMPSTEPMMVTSSTSESRPVVAAQMIEQEAEEKTALDPSYEEKVPVLKNEDERLDSIVNDTPAKFNIEQTPNVSGEKESHEAPELGYQAVNQHDQVISEMAKKHGVDADLIRAVMWAENSRGHKFGLNKIADKLKFSDSVLPMNMNKETAAKLLNKSVDDIYDPSHNIEAATIFLKRLQDRIENPTPEKIGSMWLYTGREKTNHWGAFSKDFTMRSLG